MNFQKTIFSLFALIVLSAGFIQNVLAAGQITTPIIFENALKGEEYEKKLSVLNSENQEVVFSFIAEGDIAEWTNFYSFDDLENPVSEINAAPNTYTDAKVKFLVPEDTANGTYSGTVSAIIYAGELQNTEETHSSVFQKFPRKVEITVTGEQILSANCRFIRGKIDLKKDEPLKMDIICANIGNVKIKPSIKQKITQDNQLTFSAIYPYPEDKEGIKPGLSETIPVEWQTKGIEPGLYIAEFTVLLVDNAVGEKKFGFRINETGLTSIMVKGISTINERVNWAIIAVTILIIVIAVIFLIIKKRSK